MPLFFVSSDAYRMRVCKTCDTAMEAFRKALLLGRAEDAMSAYSTGCVNLDRPYTIYHGEVRDNGEANRTRGRVGFFRSFLSRLSSVLSLLFQGQEGCRQQ